MHLDEAKLGDRLTGTVQVLGHDEKRLHLFFTILKDGTTPIATVEQMLLHVDMKAGKAVAAPESILSVLRPIAEAHKGLEKPAATGRFVGQRKG